MTNFHEWRYGEHSVYCVYCGVPQTRERNWDICDLSPFKPTAEQMTAELVAAGWVPQTATIWQDPDGCLFLGPAGAWRVMVERKARSIAVRPTPATP